MSDDFGTLCIKGLKFSTYCTRGVLARVCLYWSMIYKFQDLKIIHPVITCSKLTIETLEQGVDYVQS